MKKSLLLAGLMASMSIGTITFADDDDCYVPMSQWQSRAAVRSMAEAQGWKVRRIKIDDGCYEIKGYNASGREIEVKIDPATLAVIEFEYEGRDHDDDDYDDDDHDDDDKRKRKRRSSNGNAGTQAPVSPPNNGLFAPGSKPKILK